MNGATDYIVEPILWLVAAAIFFLLGIFFFNKYRKSEKEARAFFSGTAIFMFFYTIYRTIEVIRRYFIGANYSDIVDWWYHSGPAISDLSLILRLAFLIISWTGIAYFYFRIESTILQKKTYYILTIASILKLIVNPLLYIPAIFESNAWPIINIANIVLFIICGFFPIVLFGAYAVRNYVDKRGPWAILALGMLCFIIGEAGDNPEAYTITAGMSPNMIHFGTPFIVIVSGILLALALRRLYEVEPEGLTDTTGDDEIKKLKDEVIRLKYIIIILLTFLMISLFALMYIVL